MAYQFNQFRATRPVARVCDKKLNHYEVFFIGYPISGHPRKFRYKMGINRLPPRERKAQAEADADVFFEALKKGWNPFLSKYPNPLGQDPGKPVTFADAIQRALEAKLPHLSKYSAYDYRGCVRFMLAAARATDHYITQIDRIERKDVRAIIAEAKRSNGWSSASRNKYLALFRSLLSVACDELELMKYNPAKGIKDEPAEDGGGYKCLTDQEKARIAAEIAVKAPDYFDYLMFIYDAGIRRKEALMIRIGDINLTRREITIRAEVAKTNRARVVPITPTILAILDRKVPGSPNNWYLFSSDRFKPGPEMYHPNTPTNWWRKLVQDGLGIDCKMYSLKHRGADDKIEAGLDLDALRTLYGHRSKQMTEGYARAVRGRYKEEIIAKAPPFV